MKRLLTTLLLVLFTLGVFAAPVSVDTESVTPVIAYAQEDDGSGFWGTTWNVMKFIGSPGAATAEMFQGDQESNGFSFIFAFLGNFFLGLASLVLSIAAIFFNLAMDLSVVQFGEWIQAIAGINVAWTLIRDFANMIFIFLLLYMSISTILQIDGYTMRKSLARLVIVALLINFSLFATRVVIDASNIVANQFYEGILDVTPENNTSIFYGVSGVIFEQTKLVQTFSVPVAGQDEGLEPREIFMATVMGSIFILVFAFVLFAGAILLVLRIISLVILMITSPIAFIAIALPNSKGYAKKWWGELINQAFFAPAFIALLFLVVVIVGNPSFQASIYGVLGVSDDTGSGNWVLNLLRGDLSSVVVILNYAIVIGLTVAALTLAKKMGVRGSETVVKWGDSSRKWAQGFVGRNTLGYAGNRLANSNLIKSNLESKNKARQFAGRLALNTSEKLESATFGGAKGGYKKANEQREKDYKRYMELQASTGISDETRAARREQVRAAREDVVQAREELRRAKLDQSSDSFDGSDLYSPDKVAAAQAEFDMANRKLQEARSARYDGGMQEARNRVAETDAQVASTARQLTRPQMEQAQKLYEIEKEIAELSENEEQNGDKLNKLRREQGKFTDALVQKYSKNRQDQDDAKKRVDNIEKTTKRLIAERKLDSYSSIPQLAPADRAATEKLLKELNKNKDKQLLDEIKKLAKEDSGGDSAPTPEAEAPKSDDSSNQS